MEEVRNDIIVEQGDDIADTQKFGIRNLLLLLQLHLWSIYSFLYCYCRGR